MARGTAISRIDWLSQVDPTTNPQTTGQTLTGIATVSISVRSTQGTAAGSIQVQVSDFGVAIGDRGPVDADYVNLGSPIPFVGPCTRIPIPDITGKFVRIKWTDSGSTGALIDAAITATYRTAS